MHGQGKCTEKSHCDKSQILALPTAELSKLAVGSVAFVCVGADYVIKALASTARETRSEPWRVVFRGGTVAECDADAVEFAGFGAYEWKSVDAGILARNQLNWLIQKEIEGGAGRAVRQAYAMLIAAGAPGNSTEMPVSAVKKVSCATACWCLASSAGSAAKLYTVIYSPVIRPKANCITLSRRLDYMYPYAIAVVSPDGSVTYL